MRIKDPKEYCARCSTRYGFADETCRLCEFDPVNNPEDEKEQEQAEANFRAWQDSGND